MRNSNEPNIIEKGILYPFVGGFAIALTIVVGAYASLFTNDIKAELWLGTYFNSLSSVVKASIFWVSILLVVIIFQLMYWAQRNVNRRASSRMDAQIENLENLIKRLETLPPDPFLSDYRLFIPGAIQNTLFSLLENKVEVIEIGIRTLLGAILELVRKYDKSYNTKIKYSANIMLYKNFSKIESKEPKTFIEPINHNSYEGCLELITKLTTNTEVKDYSIDEGYKPLLLHIPIKKEPFKGDMKRVKYPVLPGAPWAYVFEEFSSFSDAGDLNDWIDENCSVDPQILFNIREYFASGEGSHIGSFASIPISDFDRKVIGVLNIDSSENGILKEKADERFNPIIEPILIMLYVLIQNREDLRK